MNGNPVDKANARLIAAAPELLEALLALVAATDADIYTDDPDFGPAVANLMACIGNARAAIAKATQ